MTRTMAQTMARKMARKITRRITRKMTRKILSRSVPFAFALDQGYRPPRRSPQRLGEAQSSPVLEQFSESSSESSCPPGSALPGLCFRRGVVPTDPQRRLAIDFTDQQRRGAVRAAPVRGGTACGPSTGHFVCANRGARTTSMERERKRERERERERERAEPWCPTLKAAARAAHCGGTARSGPLL